MSSLEDLESLSREELLALLVELQGHVAGLTASNASLRSEIAELQRRTKRQATPFSKGTRVNKPKRPGRKPGSGTFSFRFRSDLITGPTFTHYSRFRLGLSQVPHNYFVSSN